MKRIFCLILAICIAFLLPGCKDKEEPILEPVNFYYRNADISYDSSTGLISAQVTESAGYDRNFLDILNFYLKGPIQDHFEHTFPSGTKALSLEFIGSNAQIVLSNDFARLGGIDLTIACACLSMTVMELTNSSSVTIRAESTTIGGNDSITMDKDNILLFDNAYPYQ